MWTKKFWISITEEGQSVDTVSNQPEYYHACGGTRDDGHVWKLMEFSQQNGLETMITPNNYYVDQLSCSDYNMMLGGSS